MKGDGDASWVGLGSVSSRPRGHAGGMASRSPFLEDRASRAGAQGTYQYPPAGATTFAATRVERSDDLITVFRSTGWPTIIFFGTTIDPVLNEEGR